MSMAITRSSGPYHRCPLIIRSLTLLFTGTHKPYTDGMLAPFHESSRQRPMMMLIGFQELPVFRVLF